LYRPTTVSRDPGPPAESTRHLELCVRSRCFEIPVVLFEQTSDTARREARRATIRAIVRIRRDDYGVGRGRFGGGRRAIAGCAGRAPPIGRSFNGRSRWAVKAISGSKGGSSWLGRWSAFRLKARVIPTRPAASATRPWLNSLSSSIRSRSHSTPGNAGPPRQNRPAGGMHLLQCGAEGYSHRRVLLSTPFAGPVLRPDPDPGKSTR
jgi:hypothetical protein